MILVATARIWVQQLRMHQWVKNLLLLVPLLTAHRLTDFPALVSGVAAVMSFSLVASAVYVANDIADLDHDRRHPRKMSRPLASGVITRPSAVLVAAVLVLGGLSISFVVGTDFVYWLGGYLAVTTAYTFVLKKLVLVDVLTLAGLYSLRIVAGGVATETAISQWLLTFSLFLFLSLAIAKRYVELVHHLDESQKHLAGRGYRRADSEPLMAMGIAAGFAATLVMTLYLASPAVTALYSQQNLLWLTVPVLVYWLSWIWLSAHRGDMHDDPVVFSLTDRRSQVSGVLFVMLLVLAAVGVGV